MIVRIVGLALLATACGAEVVVSDLPDEKAPAHQTCQPSGCPCTGAHVWSTGFGSECREIEPELSVDSAGNVVVIGLGGSSDVCVEQDVLVAKWNGRGAPLWVRSFGNYAYQKPRAVATDAAGNVLVVGEFDGTPLDFGGGPVSGTGFLVKLDPNGNHLWSRGFGGLYGIDNVATDQTGNAIVAGRFNQTIDLGGEPLVPDRATTLPTLLNVFVAKFDSSGEHVWSLKWAAPESYAPLRMALARDGSILLAGALLDQTSPTVSGFLTMLGSNGAEQWRRVFSGNEVVNPMDVAVGSDDSVALGGFFRGAADFGTGTLQVRGLGMWAALYDASGSARWARQFGSGLENKLVSSVSVDPCGNVILAGASAESVDLGGGVLSSERQDWIPFLAKLDAHGNHLWSKSLGATDVRDWWPRARVAPTGEIAMVGQLHVVSEPEGIDLGGGTLHAVGEADFFVARFAP